jgi:hypothetical protein
MRSLLTSFCFAVAGVGLLDGAASAHAYSDDISLGWRYRSTFGRNPSLTLSYNAEATFDAGESDATSARGASSYLARVEVAHSIGPITPQAEMGYRHFGKSPFDARSSRVMFGAAGMRYRLSSRSSMDWYYEYEATAAGLTPQRSLSLDLAHRVSSRTDVAMYAYRKLAGDESYNVGVTLTVKF